VGHPPPGNSKSDARAEARQTRKALATCQWIFSGSRLDASPAGKTQERGSTTGKTASDIIAIAMTPFTAIMNANWRPQNVGLAEILDSFGD
jgi:hypothetical protein